MWRSIFVRFEPGIWLLTLVGFLNVAGFAISIPFLSLYLHQVRGLSMTAVGTIMLFSGLGSAVSQLFSGSLADRFGRRPLVLWTMAASVFLYAGIAVLVGASTPVPAIVVVFVIGRSLAMMMRPAITAAVVDLCPKERLTEAFGLLRVGQNIGWAAGPAAGGFLLVALPYAYLFWFATVTSVLIFLLVFFFLKESLAGEHEVEINVRTLFSVARDRTFLIFTGLNIIIFVVMGQMISTLSVFTVEWAGFSPARYGTLLTLNGLLVVALQYPVARGLGRVTTTTSLAVGCLLYSIGYLLFGWVGSFGLALGAMAVITMGEIIFSPTVLAVAGGLSPEKQRGHYMGFYGLSETVGVSVGPLVGGVLLDGFPARPLFVWGTIALVALVPFAGFLRWGMRGRCPLTLVRDGGAGPSDKFPC